MILINTVGTSVLTAWKEFGDRYDEAHRARLVAALKGLDQSDKRLGAELTSIQSLMKQGVVSPGDRLVFLVSDTREGACVGDVLANIGEHWGFNTESHVIKKLQGDDPKAFAQGLRNLVKKIAELYRNASGPVAINATGGYKAQISFAGLIGQVFGLPVYYQFESFPAAIELPALPVSFAFDDWLAYRHVLEALDEGEAGELLKADDSRIKSLPEKLRVLVDTSQGLATLSALGALYHEGFRERFRAQAQALLPKASGIAPADKKVTYEDGNAGRHRGLADWLERIRAVPYVTRIETFYYNPRLPGRSTVEPDPAHGDRVIAIYATHDATTKAYVFLSENDPKKAQAAAADLAERLR
ncbi:MAG TPA: putative CRISPR-associated protein [Nitrospiraceae bacterium]|jgi:putative CRISPR-associated protein (TIGR02619 family)|nr:putative CRISPR-associated protein [Nitrospiraceae bacterium]